MAITISGAGTEANPYKITTMEEFDKYFLGNGGSDDSIPTDIELWFEIENDLDWNDSKYKGDFAKNFRERSQTVHIVGKSGSEKVEIRNVVNQKRNFSNIAFHNLKLVNWIYIKVDYSENEKTIKQRSCSFVKDCKMSIFSINFVDRYSGECISTLLKNCTIFIRNIGLCSIGFSQIHFCHIHFDNILTGSAAQNSGITSLKLYNISRYNADSDSISLNLYFIGIIKNLCTAGWQGTAGSIQSEDYIFFNNCYFNVELKLIGSNTNYAFRYKSIPSLINKDLYTTIDGNPVSSSYAIAVTTAQLQDASCLQSLGFICMDVNP